MNIKVCNECGCKMNNAVYKRRLIWHAFVSNPKWIYNPYLSSVVDFYDEAIQQAKDIIKDEHEPIYRKDMFYDDLEYNLHKLDNPYLRRADCWFQTAKWLI
jgi:hypothetical protein